MGFWLKEKKVYLYGYNTFFDKHDSIIKNIRENGVSQYGGVIDRNVENLPVAAKNLEEFLKDLHGEKSDYAFILNFMNANMHVKVAEELYQLGFNNIVFLPFDKRYSLPKSRIMRQLYNSILYGQSINIEIPTYDEMLAVLERDIIREYDDYIEYWIGIEKLHIKEFRTEDDVDNAYPLSPFGGVPILDFTYYRELFDYLYDSGKYPMGYLVNTAAGRDYDSFINDRRVLFEKMKDKLKYDPEYYIDSPILVEERDDGELTVLDGVHRAFFLYYQGYKKVPVILKRRNDG